MTNRQQEVMEVLRQKGAYLYLYDGYYVWGDHSNWVKVLRRTHGCLVRAGLIRCVYHPELGTPSHRPGMPVWVWVATKKGHGDGN